MLHVTPADKNSAAASLGSLIMGTAPLAMGCDKFNEGHEVASAPTGATTTLVACDWTRFAPFFQ